MNYRSFLRHYPKEAAFGISAAFFSSFGQTFFIALFVPMMAAAASVTEGGMGVAYSVATLGSALLLPWFGALIDRVRFLPYTMAVIVGLATACFLAASVRGIVTLLIALLCLRLFGQGLMSHVAITAMAKRFRNGVGRSLGLVSIGFPAGEAVLPVIAGTAIAWIGWRNTWLAAGAGSLLLFLPFLYWTARPFAREFKRREDEDNEAGATKKKGQAWHYLGNARFLALMPFGLVIPFVMTAIFLFQTSFAAERGWPGEWVAYSIAVFAVSRAASAMIIGPLIDSLGACRLMALSLLPLIVSLALMGLVTPGWVLPVYLGLAGSTMGMASSLKTAALLEVFGDREIGAIRSLSSALMVFSTAASPFLVGVLRTAGVDYGSLIFGGLVLVAVVGGFTWAVGRRFSEKSRARQ